MEYPKTFIQLPDIPEQVESAFHAYEIAFSLARVGDVLGWRKLCKRIKPNIFNSLVQWRQNELDGQQPENKEQLVEVVDKAVEIASPLMSVALIGVESGNEHLRDQKSVLYDLLNIPKWSRAGLTVWANIPYALGYVYHSLHGSLCLGTNQLNLALSLARVKIPAADGTKNLQVWERSELRGYSESISGIRGGDCVESWRYLATACERWKWLLSIFGDRLEYRTSLVAYYMALNVHELASVIASGRQDSLNRNTNPYFHIPLTFLSESYDINQRAISLLIRNQDALTELWACLKVTREKMEYSWENWIRLSELWLHSVYRSVDPNAYINLSDNFRNLFRFL